MINDMQIGRLQLRTAPNQPSANRADVARQLRQTRLHPAHLPSSAILVIRQLTARRSSDARGGNAAWTKRLQHQIDRLSRQAARPYEHRVNDSAPSVLFQDSVELLSCFTTDLLAKEPRWYWQELFPDLRLQATAFTHGGQTLAAAWGAYPEALPGTLVQLPKAVVAQALGLLNRAQLQQAIAALHRHFGLTAKASPSQERVDKGSANMAITPPWHTWVSKEMASGLQPLAIYLWGVAHLLKKAPQVAHSPTFVAEAADWIEAQEASLEKTGLEEKFGLAARLEDGKEKRPESLMERHGQPPLTASTETNIPTPEAGMDTDLAAPEQAIHELRDLNSIQTQMGGAFYLLNIIRWLEATERLPDGQPMDPWLGVAALMAQLLAELSDERREQLWTDPLWALLAQLANQPEEALWQALERRSLSQKANDELVYTLQWWQAQFQQTIAEQLTQRLTTDREALAKLFCVPAHVRTTNTHIDVHFPPDAVSIDIRLSGLDRTPGWVPMFGYIITFIFE